MYHSQVIGCWGRLGASWHRASGLPHHISLKQTNDGLPSAMRFSARDSSHCNSVRVPIDLESQGIEKFRELHLRSGKYWTLDCLLDEQGHRCTVAVFWQLKFIITTSGTTSKIVCYMVIRLTEGEKKKTFVTKFCLSWSGNIAFVSHGNEISLLQMSGNNVCVLEWFLVCFI